MWCGNYFTFRLRSERDHARRAIVARDRRAALIDLSVGHSMRAHRGILWQS